MEEFPSPHIGTFRIFIRANVTQGNAGAWLHLSLQLFPCAVLHHAPPPLSLGVMWPIGVVLM